MGGIVSAGFPNVLLDVQGVPRPASSSASPTSTAVRNAERVSIRSEQFVCEPLLRRLGQCNRLSNGQFKCFTHTAIIAKEDESVKK